MAGFFTDTAKVAMLNNYLSTGFVVFLVNDPSNSLTPQSTMTAAAALEIAATNGYTRQALSGLSGAMQAPSGNAQEIIPSATFTATGGAIPQFTHCCRAVNGAATHGDTTGTLLRVDPCSGAPINLAAGQTYTHNFSLSLAAT